MAQNLCMTITSIYTAHETSLQFWYWLPWNIDAVFISITKHHTYIAKPWILSTRLFWSMFLKFYRSVKCLLNLSCVILCMWLLIRWSHSSLYPSCIHMYTFIYIYMSKCFSFFSTRRRRSTYSTSFTPVDLKRKPSVSASRRVQLKVIIMLASTFFLLHLCVFIRSTNFPMCILCCIIVIIMTYSWPHENGLNLIYVLSFTPLHVQAHKGHQFAAQLFEVTTVCELCTKPIPLLELGEVCKGTHCILLSIV